jgi:Predicted xylanase/chitin deacetylase
MRFLIPYLATHGLRPFHRFVPDLLWRVEAAAKTAYLTFDDGPTEELTDDLLDLLAQYDAQATHFLVGQNADRHQAVPAPLPGPGTSSATTPIPMSTPGPCPTSSCRVRLPAPRGGCSPSRKPGSGRSARPTATPRRGSAGGARPRTSGW